MYNLVVYGSLLNPKELKKHGIALSRVDTIKVKGFKRVFNQLPSWRKSNGIKKAVMNIEDDKYAWFNAIIIKELSKEYFDDLDKREIGYDRIPLKNGNVINYKNDIIENCIIYKGKKDKQSSKILPNPTYFDICLNGAKTYNEEFFNDYIYTTFQNDLNGNLTPIII